MSSCNLPTVEKREILLDEFVKVRRDLLRFPNGDQHAYYTLIPPASAVVILAVTADGYLVLNAEYRHPAEKVLLGPPGGYLNPNEDPREAARRELLEETGYSGDTALLLGSAYPYPGLSAQEIFYVLMEGVKKVQNPLLDPMEIVQTLLKRPEEVKAAIRQGEAVDASLCTALYFWELGIVKK